MPKQSHHVIDVGGANGRVNISRSRSGKSFGLLVMSRSRYAGMGLDADQVHELGRFLTDGPVPGAAIELQDPEDPDVRVGAAWNPAGAHLTFTLQPRPPWEGAPPEAELTPRDVAKLGRFLTAGP